MTAGGSGSSEAPRIIRILFLFIGMTQYSRSHPESIERPERPYDTKIRDSTGNGHDFDNPAFTAPAARIILYPCQPYAHQNMAGKRRFPSSSWAPAPPA